jgi:hypothetical protein
MEVDMKKLIIAVLCAVIFAAGVPVFAQNNQDNRRSESEYYYINISLEKIFPYRNGYVVQYRQGINRMARAYIPTEWFVDPAGKGEIITLPKGRTWPSMSVYYKNGEFSHVRLYVHHASSHQTWGIIPQNVNIDSRFDDVETLDIKFNN